MQPQPYAEQSRGGSFKIKWKIKRVSADYLAGLTLLFSSLLFFYDLLKGRYLLTERDLGPYFIPPRFFWVESIKNGYFPLWDPYQFTGHPFFANPQHAILYPLNSLFFILPFDLAFNAIVILHFFLGGLFTFLFLRDLEVSPTGSLISGLIFMLSGYLLSVHSLLSILFSSIWAPLIMMFFRRALARPGFKNEILAAIFVTLSFFGGGIEIVYGNFFVLFFMIIFRPQLSCSPLIGEDSKRSRWKGFWLGVRCLLIVSVTFLLISSVQLIPFFELIQYSIRGKGIPYSEAVIWSFAPKDILLFFLPDAYGYFLDVKKYWVTQCWLKTLYTGGLPFILGSFFLLLGKDRKLYFSLMFFSLFCALGGYNPLYRFLYEYVPFFNGIRYPAKFIYLFILGLSIISGLGFQRLVEFSREDTNKRFKTLLIALALISGFLLLGLTLGHQKAEHVLKVRGFDFPDFNLLSVNLHHAKRFLFYLTLFFLLLRVGQEMKWRGWVKVLLVFFLIADLFGNMGFYGKEKTSDYFQKTKILEMISSDQGPFRTFSTGKTISMDTQILAAGASNLSIFKEKHLPSMNLLYGVHDIWGNDVLRLKRVEDLYRALAGTPSISATNLMDLYGVKYVISVTPIEGDPRFELIYSRLEGLPGRREDLLKDNTIKLYRNHNYLPKAWLVKDFRVLDSEAILSTMITKDFQPDREVFLEENPNWTDGPSHSALPNKLGFISESNNRLRLLVQATESTLLVLNDTYFPGWKAFVDGQETKIYRANYAFRAIPLHAGTHRVEFVYDPLSFKMGAAVSFLGILGCLAISLFPRRWIKRWK
jgi:hypothetical protein